MHSIVPFTSADTSVLRRMIRNCGVKFAACSSKQPGSTPRLPCRFIGTTVCVRTDKNADEDASGSLAGRPVVGNDATDEPKPKPRVSKLKMVLAGMKVDGSGPSKIRAPPVQPGVEDTSRRVGPQKEEEDMQAEDIQETVRVDPKLIGATERIADVLASRIDPNTVKSELLTKLLDHAEQTQKAKLATGKLSHLIAGMKIDRTKPKGDAGTMVAQTPADQNMDAAQGPIRSMLEPMLEEERRAMARQDFAQQRHSRGPPATNVQEINKKEQMVLKTWTRLEEESRKPRLPPKNVFEEMINWTREGKLWKFPIDNEQGVLDHEKDVDFSEHVFLDHLIADFPRKGPIKQFMDLVIYGLSRNAFLTVQEKKEYVNWYRNYFKEKREILVDVMGEELSNFADNKIHGKWEPGYKQIPYSQDPSRRIDKPIDLR